MLSCLYRIELELQVLSTRAPLGTTVLQYDRPSNFYRPGIPALQTAERVERAANAARCRTPPLVIS